MACWVWYRGGLRIMISQDYTTSKADRQKFYDALTGGGWTKKGQKRLQERFEESGIFNVSCSSSKVVVNHHEYYRKAYHVRNATMVLNNPKNTGRALVELTAELHEDIEVAREVLLMAMRNVSRKMFKLKKARAV